MYIFNITKKYEQKEFIANLYKYEEGNISAISKKTTISRTTINNLIKGKTKPSNKVLNKIYNAYPDFPFNKCGIKKQTVPLYSQRIRECREIHQMTTNEVADEIGITYSSYLNIEKGQCPSENTFEKLADLFHVSVSYLRGNTDIANADNEVIGNELGMDDQTILAKKEINKAKMYGEKQQQDIKKELGFSYKDISNYILRDKQLVDIFYLEALKVLSYYSGGKFKNSFDSLFNEMEVDLTENELLGNDNDKDYIPMEISTPYRVTIETMAKAILQKKIGIMFDEFIDEIVKKKQISKYNDYNYQEKKIKEQISKLEKELSDIEQIKKNN